MALSRSDLEAAIRLAAAYDLAHLETADIKIIRNPGTQTPALAQPPMYGEPTTAEGSGDEGETEAEEDPRYFLERVAAANLSKEPT
jgi:hypothetical protein